MLKLVKLSSVIIVLSSINVKADTISIINSVNDKHFNLPKSLVLGTALVESRMRCNVTGRAGEQGLFQIKPATARGIGFTSGSLYSCETNAYWGLKHLSIAYAKCGTILGAAKLHNAGLYASCAPSRYSYKVVSAGNSILNGKSKAVDDMPTASISKNKPSSSNNDDVMTYLMNKSNSND